MEPAEKIELLQLSQEFPFPKDYGPLEGWQAEVEQDSGYSLLSQTNRLRAIWINYARGFARTHKKKCIGPGLYPLPGGQEIELNCYGDVKLDYLESKLAKAHLNRNAPQSSHVIFRSGMAAISALLFTLADWWKPTQRRPLKALGWGNYFETVFQLEVLQHEGFSSDLVVPQEKLFELISRETTH